MKRTVDMLIREHALVANFSSLALVVLALSVLAVGLAGLGGLPGEGDPLNTIIGLLLGTTVVLSLLAMVLATYFVIKKRGDLIDWGLFLAVTWFLPYIGIATYLGGSNLIAKQRQQKGSGN